MNLGVRKGLSEPSSVPVMPPGVMLPYAPAVTAPSGWLLCDGSAVSRSTYAALFAVLGTQYGAGDGGTTFNLPDMRGRVPVGFDVGQTEFNTLGETGGEKTHVLVTGEMPAHSHGPSGGGSFVTNASNSNGGLSLTTGGVFDAATTTVGSGNAHNNLQPYMALPYIIKT